ncbi:hypothetical protein BBD46_19525 [Natrialba sp. SSL1]|nr:hypothetical protein BBD46_19525 [Natrialba sp. SSL1]
MYKRSRRLLEQSRLPGESATTSVLWILQTTSIIRHEHDRIDYDLDSGEELKFDTPEYGVT